MADIVLNVLLSGNSTSTPSASTRYSARSELLGSSSLIGTPTVGLGVQSPIRYQPASRVVSVSSLVQDAIDLFRADGRTRAPGVQVEDLNLKLFFNGSRIEWPLVSGVNVQNLQVTSGRVYWSEIEAGFYTLRFYPNVVGSWRVLLTYPEYDQAVSLAYEVVQPTSTPISVGLRTSFIR